MKVITQRDCILSVSARWRSQYGSRQADKFAIYKELQTLNLQECSAKDVADIIGNSTWTELNCDECEEKTDWVLQLGDEPDYKSSTVYLCKKCLKKAAEYLL